MSTPPVFHFQGLLHQHGLELSPLNLETLQVNITKLCNQACHHCHVDASPKRTEQMTWETMQSCLEVLARHPEIKNLDITGGAPELHPQFQAFVRQAFQLGKQVMVRHNLTVMLDPHPLTGESLEDLPRFFADHQIEVISSLPFYEPYFTDKQRGRGVFEKSLEAMRRLNQVGYGIPESGLRLHLVYNPVGAFLPAAQASLEADYQRQLQQRYGVRFNRLYTITNMPIQRFKAQLQRLGAYEEYMTKLVNAFNPSAAQGVMCRSLLSVGYDGRLYDCDFNQMLELGVHGEMPQTIFEFDEVALRQRRIIFEAHCFGCTAGAGSSCGGTTA